MHDLGSLHPPPPFLIKLLAACVLEEAVTLSSGRSSSYYVDVRPLALNRTTAPIIGEALFDKISNAFDRRPAVIGGVAIGGCSLVGALMTYTKDHALPLSGFYIRAQPKDHGKWSKIIGKPMGPAIIVDDVVTTGQSLLNGVRAAQEYGLAVYGAVSLLDRDEGAKEMLLEEGIQYEPVVTMAPSRLLAFRDDTIRPW